MLWNIFPTSRRFAFENRDMYGQLRAMLSHYLVERSPPHQKSIERRFDLLPCPAAAAVPLRRLLVVITSQKPMYLSSQFELRASRVIL
jgi:hypothetical protein